LGYDDQGRLTSVINRKPDASILSSYSYGYDYNQATGSYSMKGYRTSMTDQSALEEKYYFDDLYQLTRVDYGNGDVHQWSYDDIGNRMQQIVTPFGQSPIVTNYTYYQNGQGRNSQLLASDGTNSYSWDNNGNLLTKDSTNYTWDYDDRLVGISSGTVSASYAYDYQGERIKKTIGGVETGYLYQAEDIVKETSGGNSTNYLHGIGIDDPAMLDRAGAKSYYFGDGLGSIREMTDATGTLQNSYSYGAWGELRTSSTTVANSYGYTGREFGEEGLYFYRARYLDPGLGRFLSKDLINNTIIAKKSNKYYYVENTPINSLDSFGLFSISSTCNCYKKNIQGNVDSFCSTFKHNQGCNLALRKLGGIQLLECIKRDCESPIYPVIECKEVGGGNCGSGGESTMGFYLTPNAAQNNCGHPPKPTSWWIAHETFHLCMNRHYTSESESERDANYIASVCGNKPQYGL